MVVWGGFTNSWGKKRSERQGKKERYIHLNAEFQRIVRRTKKAFLSDQCKEIEENNRMGKTKDLFKKIRDTKGKFHAKMGSIKDRNGTDLTEAEDIKKRRQEDTQSESEVAQSCPTLCDHMNGSLPGSAIHGIFQARILEWAAISFSRGPSQPRDRTRVSCIADRHFTIWATRETYHWSLHNFNNGYAFGLPNSWKINSQLLPAGPHWPWYPTA